MLPDEADNRKRNVAEYSTMFLASNLLLHRSLQILPAFYRNKKLGLPELTVRTLVNLFVRDIRRFRSAEILCETGHTESAALIVRSMFESLLAERFIVGTRQAAYLCSASAQAKLADYPPKARGARGIEYRTWMYLAYPPLVLTKKAKDAESIVGNTVVNNVKQFAQEATDNLGEDVARRIKKERSYSLLQVAELAEAVGLAEWHRKIYYLLSFETHSNANAQYIINNRVHLGGEIHRIEEVLPLASGVFAYLLSDFAKISGYSVDAQLRDLIFDIVGRIN
jgi:hypothetical protein